MNQQIQVLTSKVDVNLSFSIKFVTSINNPGKALKNATCPLRENQWTLSLDLFNLLNPNVSSTREDTSHTGGRGSVERSGKALNNFGQNTKHGTILVP